MPIDKLWNRMYYACMYFSNNVITEPIWFFSFNHSAKEKADVDNLDIKSFLNKEAFDQSMSKEKVRERERERERESVCVSPQNSLSCNIF